MQKKQDLFKFILSNLLLRLIIGGAIIVVGILVSDIPMMLVSQGWPSTDGKILYHKFVGQQFKEYDGDLYTNLEVFIRYEYFVDGISYTSLSLNSIDNPLKRYPPEYAGRRAYA